MACQVPPSRVNTPVGAGPPVTVTVNTKVVFVVPLPGSTLPVKTVVPQENAAVGATNQGSTAKSQPTAAMAAASRRRRPDECVRFVCMSGWPDRTGRLPRPALGPKGRNHRYVRTGPGERSSRDGCARRTTGTRRTRGGTTVRRGGQADVPLNGTFVSADPRQPLAFRAR